MLFGFLRYGLVCLLAFPPMSVAASSNKNQLFTPVNRNTTEKLVERNAEYLDLNLYFSERYRIVNANQIIANSLEKGSNFTLNLFPDDPFEVTIKSEFAIEEIVNWDLALLNDTTQDMLLD